MSFKHSKEKTIKYSLKANKKWLHVFCDNDSQVSLKELTCQGNH